MAVNLERAGKVKGALKFYHQIVREAPQTTEGRSALMRIETLIGGIKSPPPTPSGY